MVPVTRIGPYEILGELGRGAMGVVYRGLRPDLEREFAIKVLHFSEATDPATVRRFEREARAAARLAGHAGIVGVHDVGADEHCAWFAMDLIDGPALDALIDAGDLTADRAAAIVEGAARAVHHAHEQGVLHRDLKPGNILVAADGTPRVADFGLASVNTGGPELTRLTQSGQVLGTPAYMPPEQALGGGLDSRADVWALGATLYEALANVPPFDGDSVHSVLLSVIREEPRPLRQLDPRLPVALEVIVGRCLEKDPALRYPTALALAEDLARWRAGEPVLAKPPGAGRRLIRLARRHRVIVAGALVGVLAAVAVAVALVPGWLAARTAASEAAEGERAAREREQAAVDRRGDLRPHLDRGREVLRRLDRLFGTPNWTLQQASALASEARTHFERAREIAPDESDVLLETGRTFLMSGRREEAGAWFDRAVNADPKSAPARLERVLLSLEQAVGHSPHYRDRIRRRARGDAAAPLLAAARADLAHPSLGDDLPANAPERRFAGALAELVDGRAAQAGPALERLAAERVTDPRIWYWAGMAWRLAGRDARALVPLARGVQLRPRDGEMVGSYAAALMEEGEFDAALKQFDLAMTGLAVTAGTQLNRGSARLLAGRPAEALQDFEVVLQAGPSNLEALVGRATARDALGDHAGAIADLDVVLAQAPDDARALYNRGNAKRNAGEFADAEADYDRALKITPEDADVWTNRGVARHNAGNLDGALADYARAVQLDSQQFHAAINRAQILRERGDLGSARRELEALLERAPGHGPGWVALARVHAKAGDPDAASAAFDRGVTLAPGDLEARMNRGVFRMSRGDRAGALADLNAAVAAHPTAYMAIYNRGAMFARTGEHAAAIRDFERVQELAPAGSAVHVGAGSALVQLRRIR